MSITRSIRTLPKRVESPADPAWVNEALRSRERRGIERGARIYTGSRFGSSAGVVWKVVNEFLPAPTKGASASILYVGVGKAPCPALFEAIDCLHKTGKNYSFSAIDLRRDLLEGSMRVSLIKIKPKDQDIHLLDPFYRFFIGTIRDWEGPNVVFHVPEEVKNRIELLEGDIATAVLPQEKFDLIICLNVLRYMKHASTRELALYNMASSLRKGGFLVTEGHRYFADRPLGAGRLFRKENDRRLSGLGLTRIDPPLDHDIFREQFALQRE